MELLLFILVLVAVFIIFKTIERNNQKMHEQLDYEQRLKSERNLSELRELKRINDKTQRPKIHNEEIGISLDSISFPEDSDNLLPEAVEIESKPLEIIA